MTAADRALLRIREEMTERRITQRDLADTLRCSQGRIAKIMTGGVNLRVNDLEALAHAVGLSLAEAARDRGLEFYAEMTPTEVRLLEALRRHPDHLGAIMSLLQITGAIRETPNRTKRPGPGRPLTRKVAR